MELQKWKILQNLDPSFAADVQRAYLVGISSFEDFDNSDDDEEEQVQDTEKVSTLSIMDEQDNSAYGGAVVIMRNDDVYFITRDPKDLPHPLTHDTTKDLLPFVPLKIDTLCGQQIRAVNGGEHHVVVLTAEGRIYQWGYIYCEGKEIMRFEPKFVTGEGIENKRVIQIACGQEHTVALTSEGDLYAWGSNRFGQLGTGLTADDTNPAKISGFNGLDVQISMVACCGWTSFGLDKDGMVWSWGDEDDGALGCNSSAPQIIPFKITSLKNIKMIATGNTHALALSHKRQLYFWGQHKSEGRTMTPTKIDIPNIVFIGATRGCTISAFQTAKRKVYFWGVACGHELPHPAPTQFSTINEVFASLDFPVLLEPLVFDLKQPIAEKLKLNFDDEDTADLRFSVEGKTIYAHRVILKSRSDHFKRMFDNNWKEDDEKQLEIQGFSYQGLHAFLFFLYTERVDPAVRTVEDAIELLRLSDYYGEEDLKRRCERLLKIMITEDKVSKAYAISCQYNANDLRELALDFIAPNLNSVVKTDEFRKMPDDSKNQLFLELADEDVLIGLKRRRKR